MSSKQSWRQNMTSGFLAATSQLYPCCFSSVLPSELCSSFPARINHSRPIIWIKSSRRSNQGLPRTLSVSFRAALASWVISLHQIIWGSSGCVTLQSRSVSDINITANAWSFIRLTECYQHSTDWNNSQARNWRHVQHGTKSTCRPCWLAPFILLMSDFCVCE